MVARRALNPLATAVILLLLATPFTADAQPREKLYRIGYIQTAMPDERAGQPERWASSTA
jgi:hypothetical protein